MPVSYGIDRIQQLLPHRFPFLLVDRVLEAAEDGTHLVAIKNVTFNEPFFQGHFPGNPIMPGVLHIEAIAQACGLMCLSATTTDATAGVKSYDTILANVAAAPAGNVCLYMAINRINRDCVRHVCRLARDTPHVRAVSFNFHTPYPDTAGLALTTEQKRACCADIAAMMDEGAPVFNLRSVLPYVAEGRFPAPCRQCVVVEGGRLSVCGRCIDVPGLCEKCGYFFVAEYTLAFRGRPRIVLDMLRTYTRYV